jgi:hypothetical protein
MSFSVQVRTRYLLAICFLLVPIAAFSGDAASDASAGGARPKLTNRFRFLTAEAVSHFRYVDAGEGKVTARDVFYKLSSRVQLNIKADGRTYIQARGESGQNFIASYDYTGIGMHDAHWSFNLKSLFIGQKIGKYLEAQAGGIEFDRGAGTEVTYADNDAWLEGYRLTYLGSSHKILPEKINLTIGYVGDFLQPNIFARLPRMGEQNYVQLLAAKKLGQTRDLSLEFDSIQTIRFTRQGFHWQKMPSRVVDECYIEAITRASDQVRFGWSASLYKTLDIEKRFRPGVFYSDMPDPIFLRGRARILQNGDSYVFGKRIGPTFRWILPQNFEISLFGSRRLDSVGPRYRAQIAVRYQFQNLLNRLLP